MRLPSSWQKLNVSRRRSGADGRACLLRSADVGKATSQAAARRRVNAAIESVASRLGNTKAVCRKSYVHPAVVDSYLRGTTIGSARRRPKETCALDSVEVAVVRLIAQSTRTRKIA